MVIFLIPGSSKDHAISLLKNRIILIKMFLDFKCLQDRTQNSTSSGLASSLQALDVSQVRAWGAVRTNYFFVA